jgi:hypothetical protein
MPRQDYYEHRDRRLARLDTRARALGAAASATWQRASAMADRIPFGQPILVGHHSEGRDRRYRAKIRRTFDRAHETQQAAEGAASAAKAAAKNRAISSDAPDAIARLRAKMSKLERWRDLGKAINRAIRLTDHAKGAVALRALGLTDEQIAAYRKPDFAGRIGVPDYEFTNTGSEIRRIKKRIADLEAEAARAAAAPLIEREVAPGVVVTEDAADNRIRLTFPGKPDEATRDMLKAAGFRWSHTAQAWQRQPNNGARYAAARIVTRLQQAAVTP